MSPRKRKFIGTVLLLAFLPVYIAIAVLVAVALQLHATGPVVLTYSAIVGLAWTIPAGLLIRWMVRPTRRQCEPCSSTGPQGLEHARPHSRMRMVHR